MRIQSSAGQGARPPENDLQSSGSAAADAQDNSALGASRLEGAQRGTISAARLLHGRPPIAPSTSGAPPAAAMSRVRACHDLQALAAALPEESLQVSKSNAGSPPSDLPIDSSCTSGAATTGSEAAAGNAAGASWSEGRVHGPGQSDVLFALNADLVAKVEGLDPRGNDIEATRLETDWAVDTLRSLPRQHTLMALRHAAGICTRAAHGEMDAPEDEALPRARLRNFHSEISQAIKDLRYEDPYNRSGDAFIDSFVENPAFKIIIDRFDIHHAKVGTPERWAARSAPEFMDRGRRMLEDSSDDRDIWLRRRPSTQDMDAGIAAEEYRPTRAAGALAYQMRHGKGIFASEQTSEVASRFRQQKAPFISGASGGICTIAWSLKIPAAAGSTPEARELSPEQLASGEAILGAHIAAMVFGGHHSVSEGLIAAKAAGFFESVPHPLEDYKGAMSAFQARMKELGVDHGERSLVHAAPDQAWSVVAQETPPPDPDTGRS